MRLNFLCLERSAPNGILTRKTISATRSIFINQYLRCKSNNFLHAKNCVQSVFICPDLLLYLYFLYPLNFRFINIKFTCDGHQYNMLKIKLPLQLNFWHRWHRGVVKCIFYCHQCLLGTKSMLFFD